MQNFNDLYPKIMDFLEKAKGIFEQTKETLAEISDLETKTDALRMEARDLELETEEKYDSIASLYNGLELLEGYAATSDILRSISELSEEKNIVRKI